MMGTYTLVVTRNEGGNVRWKGRLLDANGREVDWYLFDTRWGARWWARRVIRARRSSVEYRYEVKA